MVGSAGIQDARLELFWNLQLDVPAPELVLTLGLEPDAVSFKCHLVAYSATESW